jgi:peptidoglycan hydrolase CwlO-like protein
MVLTASATGLFPGPPASLVTAGAGTTMVMATLPSVVQPEVQRQVRQQRADIDSLYELVSGVDQKVDTLEEKVGALDQKVDALDQKVDALDEKVDALDMKLDRRLDEVSSQLSEVLRRIDER